MSIVGIIGIALSTIVFFVIYFQSPPFMNRFRTYLLLYTFCNAVVELTLILLKPVIIPVYLIVYPQGLLEPINELTILILLTVMVSSGAGLLVFFLCMLVERLFAMTNVSQKNIPFYRNPVYYVSVFEFLFIYVNIVLVYFIFVGKLFRSPEETTRMIEQYISGKELLLDQQQVLISFNISTISYFGIFIGPLLILYFIIFIILFILCARKIKQFMVSFTKKNRTLHLMLFRCLVFQCLSMCILVFIPMISFIVGGLLGTSSSFLLVLIILIWSFPIFDNIITLTTITPYRLFITNTIFRYKQTSLIDEGHSNK